MTNGEHQILSWLNTSSLSLGDICDRTGFTGTYVRDALEALKSRSLVGNGRAQNSILWSITDAGRLLITADLPTPANPWPTGAHVHIDHDGFHGRVIGHYQRDDGYQGVVLQQDGTKVVHVYGLRHLVRK